MKLEIYKQSGVLRAIIEPSDSSTHTKALMGDNVLRLSFTHFEYVPLEVNDYIIFEGERFMLRDDYRPTQKSTIEYVYDVEFCGIESYLKDALVLYLTDGEDEPIFSLTDNARRHAQIVVDNVNRITGTKDWVLGEVVASGNKTITYEGTYCFDALSKIAEEFETEWWIEGTTINISRCEHGDAIELGYDRGLTELTKADNDQAPFFTRLFPIGSSRNIDKSDYGHTRLQLPGGVKYVEQNTHLGIKEKFEESAFSHIYPRRVGTVSSIRTEVAKGDDGEDFTIYHVRDTSMPFDVNDYLMAGQVVTMSFQPPAELGGYDFEVEKYDHATKEFRLVTQFPTDDMQLPGGLMIPNPGDPYILFNIKMPATYYRTAETELREAVDEWIEKYSQDVSIYRSKSHYVYFERNKIDLKLGRRVKLYNDVYFAGGSHATRVTSISRKINRPSDIEIECCYAVAAGRIASLESGVADIQTAFKEYLNQEHLQVLKSWDSSDPTEYNVLSSVRTIRAIGNTIKQWAAEADLKFLRKDIEDTAAEFITFAKGLEVVGTALLENMTVRDKAVFLETLSSEKFVSGFPAGSGWAMMWKDFINAAGENECKAMLELDEITVRGALRVYEMIILQLVGENGTRLTTDMMRVESIDTAQRKIFLDTEKGVLYNPFRSGDILMVQRFNGLPSDGNTTNMIKSYELVVDEVGIGTEAGEDRLDWLTYSTFTGNVADVAERDVLTRVDSLYNDDRKGVIKQTSVEAGSPYLDVIYGMKTDPDNAVRARLGRLAGLFDYWWGQLKGYGLMSENVYLRGDFQLRTGTDVRTQFEILEGMFRSAMQSVTYNFTEEENFLTNATFLRDMEGWEHESDIDLYQYDGMLLDIGENFLCGKNSVAEVVEYDGRQMLRLRDSFIRQRNDLIRKPDEGSVLYINFRYRCVSSGQLRVGFDNTTAGGDFALKEYALSPHIDYDTFEASGYWDGTGDFYLGFTGDIYIDLLSLANKPLDDYKREVSTLFEQTDEYIKAVATEVNNIDNYIKTAGWITEADGHKWWATHEDVDELGNRVTTHEASFHVTSQKIEAMVRAIEAVEDEFSHLDYYVKTAGWITTADGNKLWATIDEVNLIGENQRRHESSFHVTATEINSMVSEMRDGNQIISRINQTSTTVTISAQRIKLEGVVTANSYFKINTDGSMTAQKVTVTNGIFTDVIIQGSLRCAFQSGYYSLGSQGPISVSTPGLQNNNHVVIPGSGGGWTQYISVPWTSDYNGFRAIILNEDWGGTTSAGTQYCNAASNKYFWENGKRMSTLSIGPKEGVEMIGFAEGTNFKGWLILNRFSTTSQSYNEGFPFRVMYAGSVYQSGAMRRYKGYDNDKLTCTKLSEGKYRVRFGTAYSTPNNYVVFLTGEDESGGTSGRYASVLTRQTGYFDVYTGDDASPNNAAFHFLVVSTAYWGT